MRASYYLDLTDMETDPLEQLQAQAAELWLRYRPDQRRMLTGFFRTILELCGSRRHGHATAGVVYLEPDPTDTLEAVEQDLGTAMARMLAMVDDPTTLDQARMRWSGLLEEAKKLREQIRAAMGS